MKTYKHLFEDMVKTENIRECFLTAAKKKTLRREVAEVIREERPPGCTDPGPQCLQEHVDALQKILIAETYIKPFVNVRKLKKIASKHGLFWCAYDSCQQDKILQQPQVQPTG